MLNAQLGAFKIRNNAANQIGYNNYKYLSFGNSRNAQYNNGAWAIEHYNGGLNFWKPWLSYKAGNYNFFLRDNGYEGIRIYLSTSNQSKGNFLLEGDSLNSGTYYYSLTVNNIVGDTRFIFLIK